MSSALPFALGERETVLRQDGSIALRNRFLGLGYRQVLGTLWLTNERLIFHGGTARGPLVFPLSRVSNAAVTDRQIKTDREGLNALTSFGDYSTLMRVDFDNGGREYFAVKDLAGWTEGILDARSRAPRMDYITTPNRRPAVEIGARQVMLWVLGAAGVICLGFACCSAAPVILPVVYAVLGSGK